MKRLLLSLYGFAFFNKFLLLTPVYAIFMQQHGLTDLQLSSMFIVSSIATILGQMPITFTTNRLGQRYSMIVGQFLKIAAILLWLVMPNITGFVIGMVLWGVQAGFRSVAYEGLIYDAVSANGHADDYTRILGRKATFESIGVALSAFGSLLMFMGYDWVTWASVVAMLCSILCLLAVPMTNVPRPTKKTQFRKMFRTGIRICFQTPCLLPVMLLALFAGNIPYLDDFLSPIGLQIGIPTEYVGMMSLFLLGCATIGQRFAYKFSRIPNWLISMFIGLIGLGYILFAFVYSIGWLWVLGVSYILIYGVYTLLYSQFQSLIPSRHRSVVLSFYTTITHVVYMAVCGIIGLGGSLGSWRYSFVVLGVLMLLLCVWSAFVYSRRRCATRVA